MKIFKFITTISLSVLSAVLGFATAGYATDPYERTPCENGGSWIHAQCSTIYIPDPTAEEPPYGEWYPDQECVDRKCSALYSNVGQYSECRECGMC